MIWRKKIDETINGILQPYVARKRAKVTFERSKYLKLFSECYGTNKLVRTQYFRNSDRPSCFKIQFPFDYNQKLYWNYWGTTMISVPQYSLNRLSLSSQNQREFNFELNWFSDTGDRIQSTPLGTHIDTGNGTHYFKIMKDINMDIAILLGSNMIFHIFWILINYTNNIKLTIFLIERAVLLFIEFIVMSRNKSNTDLTFIPSIKDAINFAYKKTIGVSGSKQQNLITSRATAHR